MLLTDDDDALEKEFLRIDDEIEKEGQAFYKELKGTPHKRHERTPKTTATKIEEEFD